MAIMDDDDDNDDEWRVSACSLLVLMMSQEACRVARKKNQVFSNYLTPSPLQEEYMYLYR